MRPVHDSDPVRSIRIAATLNERYGALLRTDPDTIDNLELKIGEAQQLYPEIWRHMDEARAALRQQGIAVAAYDELRATEQAGTQAVSDIESAEHLNPFALVGGGAALISTKTATFNAEGNRKAKAACRALEDAMPHVDWAGLARAEQAEIDAAGSLTASNWKQLGTQIGILLAVLAVVYVIYRLVM